MSIQTTLTWHKPDEKEPIEMQEIFVAYSDDERIDPFVIKKGVYSEGLAVMGSDVQYLSHCLLWASLDTLKTDLISQLKQDKNV